jgi:hypothetical protein
MPCAGGLKPMKPIAKEGIVTEPTPGRKNTEDVPIILRVKRLKYAISRANYMASEPCDSGYRVSMVFNTMQEAQTALSFLNRLVTEDSCHSFFDDRRNFTEEDALKMARGVYLDDRGPPQEQILLMPRELVEFYRRASREYVLPRDHIAKEIAPDVRKEVSNWLRDAANDARVSDPDAGIFPNEAQAVLFERLAAEVERAVYD